MSYRQPPLVSLCPEPLDQEDEDDVIEDERCEQHDARTIVVCDRCGEFLGESE